MDFNKKEYKYYIGSGLLNLKQEFKGEKHVPLRKDGKWTLGQFCGPNTRLLTRLERGDDGIDYTDHQCKLHDIDYARIHSANVSKKEKEEMARKSDKRLIHSLEKVKGWNASLVRKGIKFKNRLEDMGLLSKSKYL